MTKLMSYEEIWLKALSLLFPVIPTQKQKSLPHEMLEESVESSATYERGQP